MPAARVEMCVWRLCLVRESGSRRAFSHLCVNGGLYASQTACDVIARVQSDYAVPTKSQDYTPLTKRLSLHFTRANRARVQQTNNAHYTWYSLLINAFVLINFVRLGFNSFRI